MCEIFYRIQTLSRCADQKTLNNDSIEFFANISQIFWEVNSKNLFHWTLFEQIIELIFLLDIKYDL